MTTVRPETGPPVSELTTQPSILFEAELVGHENAWADGGSIGTEEKERARIRITIRFLIVLKPE
jgi:hypothetical protein